MSGHNKWSKVKNVKGKEDAKKASAFTKLARKIMVAAREGGPDPNYNSSLATAIEKAREENMPNSNIERAIKKGTGQLEGQEFTAITYEGYGPEGVAVIVECLTDNKNRTASNIRHAFETSGGNLGTTGSVTFQFSHKGILALDETDKGEEELMMDALEAGAEDVKKEGEGYLFITDPTDFAQVSQALKEMGYHFRYAQVGYLPKNQTSVEDPEGQEKMEGLLEKLEEDEDVQDVYSNWADA